MVKMTKNEYQCSILTGLPDATTLGSWENFLQNSTYATHYVTPDFFSDPFAGSGERFVLLVIRDEQIDAVLSGLRQRKSLSCGLPVRPQTAFRNGINTAAAATALAAGLTEFGASFEITTLYSWVPVDEFNRFGYEHEICSGADQVVMLELTKGADALFKDFSERRRTDLRKTMRQAKVKVKKLENNAELREFYELHKTWSLQKGIEPDNWDAFKKILSSKHRAVFIALHNGRIIAGTYLRFCGGGVVEYAANNSLEEFQKLRANELLGWRAIEWACASGFRYFSLGACHQFLARFGGETVAAHRYRLDKTLFKRHKNRERVERLAIKTYLSLPESVRRQLKSAVTKV